MTEPDTGSPAGSAILTVPNAVSVIRLLLVPVFAWLLLGAERHAAAGWLLLLIAVTDWVDGYLARRLDQVSELGKLLDPVADRVAVVVALVGGLVAGLIPAWFAWAVLVREAIVAAGAMYLGAVAGSGLSVRRLGKIATALVYAAVVLWIIGVGGPWRPFEVAAWVVGIPGLVMYYLVAWQYVGDARRVLAGRPQVEG